MISDESIEETRLVSEESRRRELEEQNEPKIRCEKCGPVKPILKMGGVICEKCRVIVFWPHTFEYKSMLKIMGGREA